MSRFTIPRRTLLRGAGGAALALPALDVMRGAKASAAAESPRRFVFCYADQSIGTCYRIQQSAPDLITPKGTGADYELTLGLKCVGDAGVKSEVGLVSGLHIPMIHFVSSPARSAVPPGGANGFHAGCISSQLGGTACDKNDGPYAASPRGWSFDQAVVDLVSGTVPIKTLPLCVSPQGVFSISHQRPDANAPKDQWGRPVGRGIAPIVSPKVIYQKLFGVPVSSEASTASAAATLALRKGIISTVSQRTKQLLARLGQEDRVQMERYFDQIRTIENRILKLDPADLASCRQPPAVGEDPAPPREYEKNPDNTEKYDLAAGWSNETLRGKLQADFIHAAFACDQTRVVSWVLSHGQLNMHPAFGYPGVIHACSHDFSSGAPLAGALNWTLKPVMQLVKLLKDTPDIDGRKMIDNTVILVVFEGGWGRNVSEGQSSERVDDDPDYNAGLRYAHSSENMVVIMAGGRGLGLQTAQHIHFDAAKKDVHPAQVMLTAIRSLGYPESSFGEISGPLPEMLTLPA